MPLGRRLLVVLILSSLVIYTLLGTTPDRVGPVGITGLFILLLLLSINLGMLIRSIILDQPSSLSALFVVLLSIGAVALLALNTISVGIGDVFLIAIFVVLFMVYWSKLRQH